MNKLLKLSPLPPLAAILASAVLILAIVLAAILPQASASHIDPTSVPGASWQPTETQVIYLTPDCQALPECDYIRAHGLTVVTPEP